MLIKLLQQLQPAVFALLFVTVFVWFSHPAIARESLRGGREAVYKQLGQGLSYLTQRTSSKGGFDTFSLGSSLALFCSSLKLR